MKMRKPHVLIDLSIVFSTIDSMTTETDEQEKFQWRLPIHFEVTYSGKISCSIKDLCKCKLPQTDDCVIDCVIIDKREQIFIN